MKKTQVHRRNYYSDHTLNKKRSEIGRRNRATTRQNDLVLTPKCDLTLEQRINAVVAKALQHGAMGPQLDVIRDGTTIVISRHCVKVG